LGTQGFYKNEFVVNDSVLIPRPETELLVELLLQSTPLENARVAEVGVGSGCVSISYLLERPDARGWATDVSPGAISVAQQNAAQLQVQPRLTLLLGSVLEPVAPLALKFHAIVSNPPYLVSGDAQVAKDVHQHEPHSALYVPRGMDPLFVAKAVADQARALLLPGGILGIEIDSQCHADALEMLQSRGYRDVATVCDLAGLPRVVWGVRVGL
jgi:release factor glutamine methyltransferase